MRTSLRGTPHADVIEAHAVGDSRGRLAPLMRRAAPVDPRLAGPVLGPRLSGLVLGPRLAGPVLGPRLAGPVLSPRLGLRLASPRPGLRLANPALGPRPHPQLVNPVLGLRLAGPVLAPRVRMRMRIPVLRTWQPVPLVRCHRCHILRMTTWIGRNRASLRSSRLLWLRRTSAVLSLQAQRQLPQVLQAEIPL
ncbi:unnamed protein product [Boreogadus saida]